MKEEKMSLQNEDGSEQSTEDVIEEPEPDKARSLDRWLQNFKHRQKRDRKPSPRRSKQDRVRPLFLGIVGVTVVVVVLLGMFSTPISVKRQQQVVDRRTPNLGRPQATDAGMAEADRATRSVTPLLRAEVQSARDSQRDLITERDLQSNSSKNVTGQTVAASGSAVSMQPRPSARPANLGQIEFSHNLHGRRDSLAEVEARLTRIEARSERTLNARAEAPRSLDKASLVYVHSGNNQPAQGRSDAAATGNALNETPFLGLPAGTRLLARLQSTITTAVTAPVVAMVEVNYERDGEIVVPAGSIAFGKIEQANSSGHVNVAFDEMQTTEGSRWRIEGIAQALDFGPLKGKVEGRKSAARFVTRAITGVGVVAAQAVGLRGGFNGPISNSVLIRDRLATNIAQAGEQHVQQLALNTNVSVTVPASTRFYVVLRKGVHRDSVKQLREPGPDRIDPTGGQALTQAELRELRSLRQEFLRLMQLAGGKDHGGAASSRDR
jgi:hypothetical protein